MRKRFEARGAPTVVSLALVLLLSAAASVGLLLAPQQKPATLASPNPQRNITVGSETFDDTSPVEVEVATSKSAPVISPRRGILSRADCEPGKKIVSGGSSFSIEGEALLNLAMPMPLWRDLELGDTGADVDSLRAGLRSLGSDLDAEGPLTRTVLRALETRLRSIGAQSIDSTVHHDAVIWTPSAEMTIERCPALVGMRIEAEDALASLAPTITSARLAKVPTGLAERQYVLDVGRARFTLASDGSVVEPGSLVTEIVRNSSSKSGDADSLVPVIQGEYRLAEPLRVLVVPPSAIVQAADDTTCVFAEGRPVPVTVVGSELGKTFLLVTDATRIESVMVQPTRTAACA